VWNKGTTKSILPEKGDGKVIDHELIYWALKYFPWYETVTHVNIMQINFSLKSLDSGTGTHFSPSISIFAVNIVPTLVHSHFHICVLTKIKKGQSLGTFQKPMCSHKSQNIGQKNAFTFHSSILLKWMIARISLQQLVFELWPIYVGSVVDKIALVLVLSPST